MPTTQTSKKSIACRVSNETYEQIRTLIDGEHPAFETMSEYLYTLIIADLGRRKMPEDTRLEDAVLRLLDNPELVARIKKALR